MKLATLYKRTRTGAIQYWKIWTLDGVIHKESGQVGTDKPLLHQETCSGKNKGRANETTPQEQANLQAQSDWNKKRDEGYKSLADLKIIIVGPTDLAMKEHYNEPAYVEYRDKLHQLLNEALPQFNTDANGEVKPMLAPTKGWKAGDKKNRYPKLIERKLDGVRTLCKLEVWYDEQHNKHTRVQFLSRSGKVYEHLRHLVSAILTSPLADETETLILDGEIYYHGWTLEEINEAVKKYRPGVTEQLEFWVYDLPQMPSSQEHRTIKVNKVVGLINHPQVKASEAYTVLSDEEVQTYHDTWVQEGYEGAMLKDPMGTYQPGQRSSFWTKVKTFDDNEYRVVGHKLGQRGVRDLILTCHSPFAADGYDPHFDVKMMGTHESNQKLYDTYIATERYVGKLLTVKHFGLSKYGIPNLPTGKAFRDSD